MSTFGQDAITGTMCTISLETTLGKYTQWFSDTGHQAVQVSDP